MFGATWRVNQIDVELELLVQLGTILRFAIWGLAFLKFWDILRYIFWLLKSGERYGKGLLSLIDQQGENQRSLDLFDLNEKHNVP